MKAGTGGGFFGGWIYDPAEIDIAAGDNPGSMFLDDGTLIAPNTTLEDYYLEPNESVVLMSGTIVEAGETSSDYSANIRTTNGSYVVDVGGVELNSGNRDTDVVLTTTLVLGEVSITKNTTTATVNITVTSLPGGGYIDVFHGGTLVDTLDADNLTIDRSLFSDTADILKTGTAETYQVLITCTSGMVTVEVGSYSYTLSAEDTGKIPADYTVGDVNADPGQEGTTSGQWSYAGWSLIIIYSDPSPSAQPHRLFLYDNFLHAPVSSTHYFTIAGFRSPADTMGSFMTCFVGEGDDHYEDDFLEFRAEHDASTDWNPFSNIKGPLNLDNSESPWDNVWNGQSPGFEGLLHEGIDIDTFDLSDRLEEGDTSADIKLKTWELENLIYIFISVPTVPSGEGGGISLGIISYSCGGD